MISNFASLALFLYAGVLTVMSTGRAFAPSWIRGRSFVRPGLYVLTIGLIVQAVGHLVAMASGQPVARPSVHLAYLAVSVVLVPAGLAWSGQDHGRWNYAALSLTALISAVLIVRVQTTWLPTHG